MSARLHPTQDELREAHGTPQEYAEAVWRANLYYGTSKEDAFDAIRAYTALYQLAGTPSTRISK